MQKNKTNTHPNPTTNPNPYPTIDKAVEVLLFFTYCVAISC